MPAPSGNANAESWTRKRTMDTLQMIEEYAELDHILTLSAALTQVRCYKQLWAYWKKKWGMEGEVMDRIYFIEQLFIVKAEEGALFRRMNASACYFILKHNYGYGNKEASEAVPSYLEHEFVVDTEEELVPEQSSTTKKATNTNTDRAAAKTEDAQHYTEGDKTGQKREYRAAAA